MIGQNIKEQRDEVRARAAKAEAKADEGPRDGPDPYDDAKKRDAEEKARKAGSKADQDEDEGAGDERVDKPKDPLWMVRLALKHIQPTDDKTINKVGRALHSTGEKGAFELFCEWVSGEKEKEKERWDNLAYPTGSNKPVTVGTLYWMADEAGWRRPIVFDGARLDRMVEQAEEVLIRQDADIYQYASKLVRPVFEERPLSGGQKGKSAEFKEITHTYLLAELAKFIDWRRFSKQKGEFVPAPPEDRVARAMLERVGRWKFRKTTGVISAPTLRPDGTVLKEEGYDPATGLILLGPPPLSMRERPTKADAERALALIDGLLDECPFVDEASRSVALSELITPTVRGALDCSPIHATDAPVAGTGKTYISSIAAAIAQGLPGCIPLAAGFTNEEFVKRLNAFMVTGISYFTIDNMTIPLHGEELCQIVTSSTYMPRIFGKLQIKELPNTYTISANGNNLKVLADLTRRVLLCKLNAKSERPELREFKRSPVDEILAARGKYIAAVLTIVRAYIVAGEPKQDLTTLNGFKGWTRFVRSPLVWLGKVDPAVTLEEARRRDTDLQKRYQVLAAIAEAFGKHSGALTERWPDCARTSSEMVEAVNGRVIRDAHGKLRADCVAAAGLLKDALMLIAIKEHELTANKIGYWFRTNSEKPVSGLVMKSEVDRLGMAHWWVEEVHEVDTSLDP
jgi:putative DNA primase/helicase